MKSYSRTLMLLTGCALGLFPLVGCSDYDRPSFMLIEQMGKVAYDRNVYISGSPSVEGVQMLQRRGVRTVIDLREPDEKQYATIAAVREMKVNYVQLPMDSERLTDEQAEKFLQVIDKYDHEPVLINCYGRNRAAAMYGLYLGMRWDMDADDAIERAHRAGMGSALLEADLRRLLCPKPAPEPVEEIILAEDVLEEEADMDEESDVEVEIVIDSDAPAPDAPISPPAEEVSEEP